MPENDLSEAEDLYTSPDISGEELEIDETIRPDTDSSFWFLAITGVLFVFLIGTLAFLAKPTPAKIFYEIIWERGPIQFFELIFAGMVFGHVIQKSRLIKRQHEYLINEQLDSTVDLGNDDEVTATRQRLRDNPGFEESILHTRLDRSLAQWLGCRDVSLVATWSGGESDREYDASASSYILSNVLLAMIPMLGFIGTVLGLSTAVAGFSQFLSGEVELAAIKDALRDVTGSLGTAFDTTLLALVLALIITFPLSMMVRRENELLAEFDSFVDDKVISKFPPPEPASIKIENLEDSIDAAFRRYIPDPDRYDEVFSRAIDRAGLTVEDKFANLIASYEGAIAEMTTKLAGSLVTAGDSVESSMRSVVSDVQLQDEQMVNARRNIAEEESNKLAAMLESYQSSVDELSKSTGDGVGKTIEAANELANKLDVVRDVAGQIENLLQLEASVEKSLTGLHATSEFQQTLGDLRKHLEVTDGFCKELRKPRVITLREEYDEEA